MNYFLRSLKYFAALCILCFALICFISIKAILSFSPESQKGYRRYSLRYMKMEIITPIMLAIVIFMERPKRMTIMPRLSVR